MQEFIPSYRQGAPRFAERQKSRGFDAAFKRLIIFQADAYFLSRPFLGETFPLANPDEIPSGHLEWFCGIGHLSSIRISK